MKNLTILLVFVLICSTGCLFKTSSSNPVGPPVSLTEPTVPTATNPITTSVATGSATVSFVIVVPGGVNKSIRASTVSATLSAPYASATLLIDNVVYQRKEAPVVGGNVTITFSGVPDSGTATLYLDLVGCSYNGATAFKGSSTVTSNTVITLSPYYPPGSNRTSDGKLLVEIGNDWRGRITFNDQGQPIGFAYDNYITNYSTGEKLIGILELEAIAPDVKVTDLAWFEGSLWVCGQEVLTKVDVVNKTATVYGDPKIAQLTQNGATLDNALFIALRDMQVVGDTLYINEDYGNVLKLKNGTFEVLPKQYRCDWFSMVDNGDLWGFWHWIGETANAINIVGSSVGKTFSLPDEQSPMSMVTYGNGYLVSASQAIYYWDGTTATKWLTPEAVGGTVNDSGAFFIYKNAQGVIYVCSEYANKIWRVE